MARSAHQAAYSEGDAFAVPLASSSYALGVIARRCSGRRSKGHTICGYFFGPRLWQLPASGDLALLRPENAVLVCRFGDLGLHNGTWPVIGPIVGWDRALWVVPAFYREQLVSGIRLKVIYDDQDPSRCVSETRTLDDMAEKPLDGLYGSAAVENVLNARLIELH
jgi:Immunity protein 26